MQGGSMDILFQLEKIRVPLLTRIFENFTMLGEHVMVVAIICAIYWCYDKQIAYRIAFGLFVSGMLVQGLKITFRIPRPWIRYTQLTPVSSVIDTATGYSFPSGHTQTATALYGMAALSTKRIVLKIACLCLMVGVAFSRMYLGVHTLQDVTASMIITGVVILIVYQVSKVSFTNRVRKIVAISIAIGSLALLIYSLTLYAQGTLQEAYAIDSCNSAFAGLGLSIGWYLESCYIQFSVKTQGKVLQVLKLIVGIVITIMMKYILEVILGRTIFGEGITNFTLILWIMVLYPMIIKKVFSVAVCAA